MARRGWRACGDEQGEKDGLAWMGRTLPEVRNPPHYCDRNVPKGYNTQVILQKYFKRKQPTRNTTVIFIMYLTHRNKIVTFIENATHKEHSSKFPRRITAVMFLWNLNQKRNMGAVLFQESLTCKINNNNNPGKYILQGIQRLYP